MFIKKDNDRIFFLNSDIEIERVTHIYRRYNSKLNPFKSPYHIEYISMKKLYLLLISLIINSKIRNTTNSFTDTSLRILKMY